MSIEAWITWGVVGLIVSLVASNRVAPDLAFAGGLTLLLAVGVFGDRPQDAFAGLSNPGTVTVAALFVVSAGLQATGALDVIGRRLLGRPSTVARAQFRLMLPVAAASAFLNNTPVVAMLIPVVTDWARQLRISPSKLLLPLSYAAIFGGICTLIGTSTNLVVYGMLLEFAPDQKIGFFDVTKLGLPCALAGIAYVTILGDRGLPARRSFEEQIEDARGYAVEVIVQADAPVVGETIEAAGLRSLPGLYLAEIQRGSQLLAAVGPGERLEAEDRLVFVGLVDSIADLQKIRGLVPATDQVFKLGTPRSDRRLVEAVISGNSPLVGRSVRDGRFRTRYDAAIIAISRGGERLRSKIGDVVLQPGDTLLLETHPEFVERQQNSRAFYLVSEVSNSEILRHERSSSALAILAALAIALASGWMAPVVAALLAAGAMVATGCLGAPLVRRSIDGSTLLVIAAAFGVGKALEVSGGAAGLASLITTLLIGSSPWIALALIYLLTNLLTEVVNNNAAAVLVFPVAARVAADMNADVIPFAFVVMIAASASFATPIGYQTNLMVYGPGGYRFGDYLRFGLPLNLLFAIVAIGLAPFVYDF